MRASVPLWGWALAIAAGGVGSLLRTALVRAFARHPFPVGVLVANTVASAVGAAAVAWRGLIDGVWVVVIVAGFCGGLSVLSTLASDTVELWMDGHRSLATRNILANVVAGVGAAWGAWALVSTYA